MISLGYMLKSEVIESQSMHSFKAYDKYLSKLLLILPRLFPHSLKKKAGGGGAAVLKIPASRSFQDYMISGIRHFE